MSQEPAEPANPGGPEPAADTAAPGTPSMRDVAASMAARSSLKVSEDGRVDVLASVGGVRGLVEALAPGLVFLGVFIGTQSLNPALIAAIAVGVVLLAVRLVRRQQVMSAVSGLVGILVCAVFARVGGEARDYYVPGFYINAAYAAGLLVSIGVRWPIGGLVFGFLHGEGIGWRENRGRLRVYTAATWILVGLFLLRLAVQLPLYFANDVTLLGTARLVMGVPLYIGALVLAWVITRPARPAGQDDREVPDGGGSASAGGPPAAGQG